MDSIVNFIARVGSTIASISFVDILDIIILAFIIYKGVKIVKETKAQQLITGIIVIVAIYALSSWLNLKVMAFLLENFLQIGIIALVIVFQPELRRILERVGRVNVKPFKLINDSHGDASAHWAQTIDVIGEAASQLSDTTTGALIVIERTNRLGEQIDTGTVIDCIPSVATFGTIFFPKTPLHDGAVIIRDAKIYAAGCFLPTPQKEETINKQLGSRHRAAIGMSEVSDAIVIVVSEETGTISVAENGELTRGYTKDRLVALLKSKLIPEKTQIDNKFVELIKSGKERFNAKKKQG